MKKKKAKLGRKWKYGESPAQAVRLSLSPHAIAELEKVKPGKKSEYVSTLILNPPKDLKDHFCRDSCPAK